MQNTSRIIILIYTMKWLFLISLTLLINFSCSTRLAKNNTGKETSFTTDKLYFERNGADIIYVYDLAGIRTTSYPLTQETTCNVKISSPSLVCASNTFYIVYPGEKVKITNNEREDAIFRIEGNEQRNNEFSYQLILESIRLSLRPRIYDSLQYQSIETILNFDDNLNKEIPTYLQKLDRASDSLASLLKIRNSFKILANAHLRNEGISIKSSFNFIFQNKLKANNLYLLKQEQVLKVLNEIRNPYQITLYGYDYIYYVARDLIPKSLRSLENERDLITNIDILDAKFEGIAKDYILAKQIFEYLKNNFTVSNKLLRHYNEKSINTEYNSIIETVIKNNKSFAKQSKRLKADRLIEASNLKITSIDEIIKNEKGKLILLDFWASWCQPCLEQMAEWERLRNDYKDKNIVFINISFDADLKAWQRKNETLGFDLKKSFVIENKANQQFIKKNDISTIPRLILLDKNGKIINSNTPEPGDSALRKLIDQQL